MKELNFEISTEPEKMFSYWKKEWRIVLAVCVSGIAFNAAMPTGALLQGKLFDRIQAGEILPGLLPGILGFFGAIVLIQALRFLKRYCVRVFANRTGATLRKAIYSNMMAKSVAQLQEESIGDLMTKAISDVEACVEGMRKFTTEVFDTGVLMLSYFVTMLLYDFRLSLLACATIPLAVLLAEKLKTIVFRYTKAAREQLSEVSEQSYEFAENALLYRLCSAEENVSARYSLALDKLEEKAVRASVLENSMPALYLLLAMVGVIPILVLGGQFVLAGQWSVGQFSAYLLIFSALALKASKAAKLFHSVQKAEVSWKRIRPYLPPVPPSAQQPTAPVPPPQTSVPAGGSSLCLNAVSFRYPGTAEPILKDICFCAKPGEIIGITGPVACGKTTLARLLQGLVPYEGSIKIAGQELRELPAEELCRWLSAMGHESELLSESVYDNITLGDPGDIRPVLGDVCFLGELRGLRFGMDTLVGNGGVRLSGGQQARLALARTLYHKAGIVLLDDPFASVDIFTERDILKNLRKHYKDRILLLISQRVSCFAQTDQVVFLEEGRADCASHKQLLESNPHYRAVFAAQDVGGWDD